MMTGYSPSNLLSQLVGNWSSELALAKDCQVSSAGTNYEPTGSNPIFNFFQTCSLTKVSTSFLKHIVSRIVLNQFKTSLKLGRDPIYLRTPVTVNLPLFNLKSIYQPESKPV